MEDAGLSLAANVVSGPAEERAIVQLRHGCVSDDAMATGGAEMAPWHVNGICRVVERPTERMLLRVGIH